MTDLEKMQEDTAQFAIELITEHIQLCGVFVQKCSKMPDFNISDDLKKCPIYPDCS